MTVRGIDVSHYQGAIDWPAVARDPAGYAFAVAKATQGTAFVDRTFERNLSGARAQGMRVGAYHFLTDGDADRQVDHFVRRTVDAGLRDGELIQLDWEWGGPVGRRGCDLALAFHAGVAARLPRSPRFTYTNRSFVAGFPGLGEVVGAAPLWVARYRRESRGPGRVDPWPGVPIWQHSSTTPVAGIAGIAGGVDANVAFVELGASGGASPSFPTPELTMADLDDIQDDLTRLERKVDQLLQGLLIGVAARTEDADSLEAVLLQIRDRVASVHAGDFGERDGFDGGSLGWLDRRLDSLADQIKAPASPS